MEKPFFSKETSIIVFVTAFSETIGGAAGAYYFNNSILMISIGAGIGGVISYLFFVFVKKGGWEILKDIGIIIYSITVWIGIFLNIPQWLLILMVLGGVVLAYIRVQYQGEERNRKL